MDATPKTERDVRFDKAAAKALTSAQYDALARQAITSFRPEKGVGYATTPFQFVEAQVWATLSQAAAVREQTAAG